MSPRLSFLSEAATEEKLETLSLMDLSIFIFRVFIFVLNKLGLYVQEKNGNMVQEFWLRASYLDRTVADLIMGILS